MKITADVAERIRARQEAERIAQRLRAEFERELQTTPLGDEALDGPARRDALERAVRRLWGATL